MARELFTRLKPARPLIPEGNEVNHKVCLLLDTSFSMNDVDDYSHKDSGCRRRIELLREAIDLIPNVTRLKAYSFNSSVQSLEDPRQVPDPSGSTDMTEAFRRAKADGFTGAVLITDGWPNNPSTALLAAQGLVLDIVYIGPAPTPDFLNELARATSGTLQIGELKNPKLLADKITALLPAPGGAIQV